MKIEAVGVTLADELAIVLGPTVGARMVATGGQGQRYSAEYLHLDADVKRCGARAQLSDGCRRQLGRKAEAPRAFRCEKCKRVFVIGVYVWSDVVRPAAQLRQRGHIVRFDQRIGRGADALHQWTIKPGDDFGER